MKIIMIIPSWHYYIDPIKHQPYWELYYATQVRNAGYDIEIFDMRTEKKDTFEETINQIPFANFYFYWIFKTGDASEIYSIVGALKNKFSQSLHVAGGTHIDKTIQEASSKMDSIIVGPGEKSFISVINDQKIGNRKKIYQTNYLDVPFSSTEHPDRSFLPRESIVNNKLFSVYENIPATLTYFSRGCVYKCAFCTYNVPNTLQVRTPEQISNEILYLKSEYGIKGILVKDEVAIHPSKTISDQTLGAIERSDIIWRGQTTTMATLDQLKKARDSGCVELAIGVETADDNVMKIINKKWQNKEQILRYSENAKKVGIKTKVCLILGLPGEPSDIVEKTIDFLKKVDADFASVSGFLPVPGSPIANNPSAYNITKIDKDWHSYSHLLYRFSDEEEVGLPFEYVTGADSMNNFNRSEVADNIKTIQNWLRDRDMVY